MKTFQSLRVPTKVNFFEGRKSRSSVTQVPGYDLQSYQTLGCWHENSHWVQVQIDITRAIIVMKVYKIKRGGETQKFCNTTISRENIADEKKSVYAGTSTKTNVNT